MAKPKQTFNQHLAKKCSLMFHQVGREVTLLEIHQLTAWLCKTHYPELSVEKMKMKMLGDIDLALLLLHRWQTEKFLDSIS